MNKAEFVDAVASRIEVPRAAVQDVIDAALGTIQETLADGQEVLLPGFGKFAVTDRAERVGRNPRTGAAMVIRATQYPRFTAGAGLRTAVRGPEEAPATTAVSSGADVASMDTSTKEIADMSKSKKGKKDDKKGKKKGKKK